MGVLILFCVYSACVVWLLLPCRWLTLAGRARACVRAQERVDSLRAALSAVQAEVQGAMFEQERTTNRVLSIREKELQDAEKRLEQERNEFEFMRGTVQPIKIGIQFLAKKVLDVEASARIRAVLSRACRRPGVCVCVCVSVSVCVCLCLRARARVTLCLCLCLRLCEFHGAPAFTNRVAQAELIDAGEIDWVMTHMTKKLQKIMEEASAAARRAPFVHALMMHACRGGIQGGVMCVLRGRRNGIAMWGWRALVSRCVPVCFTRGRGGARGCGLI